MIVGLCFLAAGYLIHGSYADWQKSPIATTITTRPIADLDFPTVTVCPPKGSHTALNYDLMKADNNSLTEEHRKNLTMSSENFLESSHNLFIKTMLATVNPANRRHMYDGFQSIPKPFKRNGFKIVTWNNFGKLSTPKYGEDYDKRYYKDDQDIHVVLEYPGDILEKIGSGSLVVQLEVDTREEEGWQEEVSYADVPNYKLYKEDKKWADAEVHCQDEGGHLAPILTDEEQQIVEKVAKGAKAWIGASDQEGFWEWSTGSSMNYTHWKEGYGIIGNRKNCVRLNDGNEWRDDLCSRKLFFICKPDLKKFIVKGSSNLTLKYKKATIPFSSFKVWYSYRFTSHKLVHSRKTKKMTGFRLSWRIEPVPMETTLQEVGRSVQTPGFRENRFDRDSFMADRTYKVTLVLPENIQEKVCSGTLVVQLEVDTREEDGWHEDVLYTTESPTWGPAKFKLFLEKKTWADAGAHCQSEGGHLASVNTMEEQHQIEKEANGLSVWIGASRQNYDNVWLWTAGSLWNYTNWNSGSRGKQNCLEMYHGRKWDEASCLSLSSFICKTDIHSLRGNISLRLNYRKDQLVFPSIHVWYNFKFNNQEVLDSWEDKRMTGFRLSWFLQDNNGSRLTETKPDMPTQWKPANADVTKYQNRYFVKMVKLVAQSRLENKESQDLVITVIYEKIRLISVGLINFTAMCSGGQVKPQYHETLFTQIFSRTDNHETKAEVIEEDIKTGFMLFSAIVYCSEPVALSQFLQSLLSTQSPRTIIQAIVNTIQSGDIRESISKERINQVYLALDSILHFQYGKILLATSSPSQLKAMLAKDWPYFTPYAKQFDQCLSGVSCQRVIDLIKTIGVSEVSLHPPHLIDSSGSVTPAALIPFCAYQTNMTVVGQTRQDLPFTVCDRFKSTILEGQICYSLNLSMIETEKSDVGQSHGLSFLVDPGNFEQYEDKQQPKNSIANALTFDSEIVDSSAARIYLNTLTSFTDYGSGRYFMSGLKKMIGTSSFLKLSTRDRKCQIEQTENCQERNYIEKVHKLCGCVPWALSSLVEVRIMIGLACVNFAVQNIN